MKKLTITLILLFAMFTNTSIFAEKKNPKVVVIGAGLSGLTTAYRLQQNGIDVNVYEARQRVGGRVFTIKVNGILAELGAQNIMDGGTAKNIHRLIEEFGLELTKCRLNLTYSYFTGEEFIPSQQLSVKFHPENLRNLFDKLIPTSHHMREILDSILDDKDPLYKTLAVRLAAYEGAVPEKLSPFYAETLFHMLLGGLSATHQENDYELLSIKGGNARLPEKMAETLGNRLHLNKPLVKVSKEKNQTFLLTFDDGQQIKADILVLTIPCAVFNDIIFEKNVIPLERLEGIKSVQSGKNAKVLVPFFNALPKRMVLINDRIVSFFDFNCSTLTLFYTGAASQFSADTILNAYDQERSMIEMGFSEACPPFMVPVVAEDRAFSSYEGVVGHSWPNDPYAKGSYSYISPGQETLLTSTQEEKGEVVKTLFAPIDQTLYFAGEHTSILFEVSGTMEAACESGERTARMIIKSCQ